MHLTHVFTYSGLDVSENDKIELDSEKDNDDDGNRTSSDEESKESLPVTSPVSIGLKRKQSMTFESTVKRTKVSENYSVQFTQLLLKLYSLLEKYTAKFLTLILSQLQITKSNRISLFSDRDLVGYNASETATSVLKALRHCWSWYDFSLLRLLMETCGIPEAVKLLDDFGSTVDFSQPLPTYPLPTISSSFEFCKESCFTVLATKIEQEYDNVSFENVQQVKVKMSEKFEVTEHCLHLMAVNSNPTVLYWMIPKSIVPTISAKVHEQCGYLHTIDISEVAIYPSTVVATDGALKIGSLTYFSTSFVVRMYSIVINCYLHCVN